MATSERDESELRPANDGVISPAVRRRLQQCYEHARKLMQQERYDADYAHSLLVECVIRDPGNTVYLDSFLANLHRKYNHNKRGSLLSFAGKGNFKRALSKGDWAEVFRRGPEALKSNPWDVAVLRGMAEACASAGLHEAELHYLRSALEARPRDAEVNRHCGRSLARLGQFDQAIACWQRVDEICRGDVEAQEMIADLQIEKTQVRTGKAPRRSGLVKRKEAAAAEAPPETARREIELTPRQQLEQTVALNPTDLGSYFALAELHQQEGRLADAERVLTKALGASGNSIEVQERLEDLETLRLKQQLEIAERRSAKEGGKAELELVEQLRSDLNRYELSVYDRRAQRQPQDLELKFQLGLRLKRAGNVREAIPLFEQAARLPARQAGAVFELGECRQRLRKYAEALEYYREAAEMVDDPAQQTLRLLAWYRAAVLAEGLHHHGLAEQLLEKVLQGDADFRDARPRLDKLKQMRHKG